MERERALMPEYRIAGVGLRDVDLYGSFHFFILIFHWLLYSLHFLLSSCPGIFLQIMRHHCRISYNTHYSSEWVSTLSQIRIIIINFIQKQSKTCDILLEIEDTFCHTAIFITDIKLFRELFFHFTPVATNGK